MHQKYAFKWVLWLVSDINVLRLHILVNRRNPMQPRVLLGLGRRFSGKLFIVKFFVEINTNALYVVTGWLLDAINILRWLMSNSHLGSFQVLSYPVKAFHWRCSNLAGQQSMSRWNYCYSSPLCLIPRMQAGAEYGKWGKAEFLRVEAQAKWVHVPSSSSHYLTGFSHRTARRGIWKDGVSVESPAEYKKRYAVSGELPTPTISGTKTTLRKSWWGRIWSKL